MQQNHAKAIKGMSIAIIVLSAITLAGCIIGEIVLIAGGGMVAAYGPEYLDGYYSSGHHHSYELAYDTSDAMAFMAIMGIVGGMFLAWAMLVSAVSLIAGIVGLRNCQNPAKLGSVFGWNIAGAIGAFLCGSIVVTVLCIIVAVFANKDRALASSGCYAAAPAYGAVPMGAQPMPGAAPMPPQPGVPVPGQPVPTVPVQPTQVPPTQVPPTNPPVA